jgi:hypothetical protein
MGTQCPGKMWKPYLLILLLGEIDQDLARRVLNIEETENRSAVVGHTDILTDRKLLEAAVQLCGSLHTPMSSTIILSKPEGPKELLMTFEMA